MSNLQEIFDLSIGLENYITVASDTPKITTNDTVYHPEIKLDDTLVRALEDYCTKLDYVEMLKSATKLDKSIAIEALAAFSGISKAPKLTSYASTINKDIVNGVMDKSLVLEPSELESLKQIVTVHEMLLPVVRAKGAALEALTANIFTNLEALKKKPVLVFASDYGVNSTVNILDIEIGYFYPDFFAKSEYSKFTTIYKNHIAPLVEEIYRVRKDIPNLIKDEDLISQGRDDGITLSISSVARVLVDSFSKGKIDEYSVSMCVNLINNNGEVDKDKARSILTNLDSYIKMYNTCSYVYNAISTEPNIYTRMNDLFVYLLS